MKAGDGEEKGGTRMMTKDPQGDSHYYRAL